MCIRDRDKSCLITLSKIGVGGTSVRFNGIVSRYALGTTENSRSFSPPWTSINITVYTGQCWQLARATTSITYTATFFRIFLFQASTLPFITPQSCLDLPQHLLNTTANSFQQFSLSLWITVLFPFYICTNILSLTLLVN